MHISVVSREHLNIYRELSCTLSQKVTFSWAVFMAQVCVLFIKQLQFNNVKLIWHLEAKFITKLLLNYCCYFINKNYPVCGNSSLSRELKMNFKFIILIFLKKLKNSTMLLCLNNFFQDGYQKKRILFRMDAQQLLSANRKDKVEDSLFRLYYI